MASKILDAKKAVGTGRLLILVRNERGQVVVKALDKPKP